MNLSIVLEKGHFKQIKLFGEEESNPALLLENVLYMPE